MPTESFLDATEKELLTIADACLKKAGSALSEPDSNFDQHTKLRLLLEAQSCLAEVIRKRAEQAAERDRRRNEELAQRDFKMEVGVMVLIGFEIVLSVVGLWMGYQQGKVLDKQTSALTHMDTSTAATADSLQKLVAAQDASLKILQEEQAQRAKKPRLALYVGSMPIDKTTLQLARRTGLAQDTASFDLLVKNIGDAPVSTSRLHVLTPEGVGLDAEQLIIVPQIGPPAHPNTQVLTLQLPLLPAGETYRLHIGIYAPKGHPAFKITFTVDAMELQAVAPLGSLTVLPPKP